jgi:beta-glucosidase
MQWLGHLAPEVRPGDLELCSSPIDFLGMNHYFTFKIAYAHRGGLLRHSSTQVSEPGLGETALGWGINPRGITAVLERVAPMTKGIPIYIAENGTAMNDEADAEGFVEDRGRVNFMRRMLVELHKAIEGGVNLRGYFYWSLLDNFEWASGYQPRFGIVRVDYATQKRTPKLSARWYADAIARNAVGE